VRANPRAGGPLPVELQIVFIPRNCSSIDSAWRCGQQLDR